MTAEVADVQAHIEEQVRRKTAELERVHKTLLSSEKMASIGKLAATVAHEINNPLFGILTYARLVLRELLKHDVPTRGEMAEQLQTIERESKRCGELVKNLLTFSRQAPSHRRRLRRVIPWERSRWRHSDTPGWHGDIPPDRAVCVRVGCPNPRSQPRCCRRMRPLVHRH